MILSKKLSIVLCLFLLSQLYSIDAFFFTSTDYVSMTVKSEMPEEKRTVNVAIIDTGVSSSINELKDNVIWQYDLTNTSSYDVVGHGTAIAGIIATLNPHVKIYSIKASNDVVFSTYEIYLAIEIAIRGPDGIEGTSDDADIINLSLNFGKHDSPIYELYIEQWNNFFLMYREKGIVFISAAGNDGDGDISTVEMSYPASSPDVIGVGSIDDDLNVSSFSSTGPHVEVVAPGRNIRCLTPSGDYAIYSGTSISTAIVSGIMSLYINTYGFLPVGNSDDNDSSTLRGLLHLTSLSISDNGSGFGLVRYYSDVEITRMLSVIEISYIIVFTVMIIYAFVKFKKKKIIRQIKKKIF